MLRTFGMTKHAAWLLAVVFLVCTGLPGEARAEGRVDWSEYIETRPAKSTVTRRDDKPTAKKRTAKIEKKRKASKRSARKKLRRR